MARQNRWTVGATFAGAVLLIMSVASCAGGPPPIGTDAATLACEVRLLSDAERAPQDYRRTGAAIAGRAVTLQYEARGPAGTPVAASRRCDFTGDERTGFYFVDDPIWDYWSCRASGRMRAEDVQCTDLPADWYTMSEGLRAKTKYPFYPQDTAIR